MPEFAPIDIPQGPLITPHIPNITGAEDPKLEDPGAGIVAAAAKGAEINGRVRAMESQLLKLQLYEQNKDIEHGLATQRMAQQASEYQQNMFLKSADNARLQADSDFKQRKYYDGMKDYSAYSSAMQGIDLDSPTAWNEATRIASEHPEGANLPGARKMLYYVGDQYNKRTAAQKASAATDQKEILNYVNHFNWQGFKPTTEPLDNPNYWVPAYKTKPDGTPDLDEKGQMQIDPDHKTYMIGKDQQGNPRYLTQPTPIINDYINRWQKVKAAANKQQITDPLNGIKPYPVDQTGGTAGAIPLPTDKSQLIQHQPYTLNDGSVRTWNGATLVPVQ